MMCKTWDDYENECFKSIKNRVDGYPDHIKNKIILVSNVATDMWLYVDTLEDALEVRSFVRKEWNNTRVFPVVEENMEGKYVVLSCTRDFFNDARGSSKELLDLIMKMPGRRGVPYYVYVDGHTITVEFDNERDRALFRMAFTKSDHMDEKPVSAYLTAHIGSYPIRLEAK